MDEEIKSIGEDQKYSFFFFWSKAVFAVTAEVLSNQKHQSLIPLNG